MSTGSRSVRALHRGLRDDIGDLVTRQAIPNDGLDQIDPFILLNHHGPQTYPADNRGLPFGPHPHRGFETVTFITDGVLLHRDTGGHESAIGAGGVQWMTAGRGLEHAEESPEAFKRSGGPLEILQLWINLPARLKFAEPKYIGLQADAIPVHEVDGGKVKVQLIAGTFDGHRGPIESLTDVHMMTVTLARGGRVTLPAPRDRNVFLYVVRGTIAIDGAPADAFHLVELNDDGDNVTIEASSDALVLFGHAAPLREPIARHGPFVMNTRDEIYDAIRDYQSGKFEGKVRL